MEKNKQYAIADISSLTGLSIDVIRYYERIGLLPPAKRKDNGHRFYSESDLRRYMFVTHLKRTQMPLKDIERYIRYYNEGRYEDCYLVLAEHKQHIERQMEELRESLGMMQYKLDNYAQLIHLTYPITNKE
ncbi:DNA-binding transcriptional regulator, MerR family [Paenibacillus sp. UNC496MF]|uniref:MerR family transcriptional regulator n=1 Tax=Paenibacillus sp. UNC496MF TaxID=1502753 RepID=UPI0008E95E66|nr:MerR family transcriptional regulator [Paenibacillus sp. UNC496MF]SFJ41559.1 DNA-binding transcriptional regulator, MerR family [Paenibacillus sp. UNC496MF]